ncbi:MAG: hypothetical protein ACFFD4_25065 [Candidatus Odinarchaeota archaeon]
MFSFRNPLGLEARVGDFLKRWKSCQRNSMKTVNLLFSLVSKLNLVRTDTLYKDLKDFPDLEKRLVFSLMDQINHCLPELSNSLNDFADIIDRYHKFQQNIRESLIQKMQKIIPDDPDFDNKILLIEETLDKVAEIAGMLETELKLKEKIVSELHKDSLNPALSHQLSFLLTIWVSEPYLEERRVKDILETFQYIERYEQKNQTDYYQRSSYYRL